MSLNHVRVPFGISDHEDLGCNIRCQPPIHATIGYRQPHLENVFGPATLAEAQKAMDLQATWEWRCDVEILELEPAAEVPLLADGSKPYVIRWKARA